MSLGKLKTDMTDWDRTPGRITVEKGIFPYVIQDESVEASSVIVISVPRENYDSEYVSSDLFYIAGGFVRINEGINGQVSLKHSFATDVERDRSALANFNISNLMHVGAYSNTIVYMGWLTSVGFYPEEYDDGKHEVFNPFKGIEPYEGEDVYDFPTYPYSPPQVNFGSRVSVPMQVEIHLHYNLTENVTELVNGWRDKILTAQAEADAEREEKIRLEEEKRAQRAAERAEWLKTPEGQVEVVGTSFVAAMKKAYPRNAIAGKEADFLSLDVVKETLAAVEDADIPKLAKYLSNEFWGPAPAVWKEFLNQTKAMVDERV